MSELLLIIGDNIAGRVCSEAGGRLSLYYEADWRESAEGHSLSMNMPRTLGTLPQKAVWPYLWNLLPENPYVLRRWAQQYHIAAANPFKMLKHVGADVPGAVQFIPPEQLEELRSDRHPPVQWMSAEELSDRLRQLSEDAAAMRRPDDIGTMSLPGAQAKTAFYWDERRNRWGVPNGRTPTTHIIKPCVPRFDGLVENEHLCQNIAARLGMPAARSSVLTLDQTYIVVERYDRLPATECSSHVARVHQEDMCQALGLMPARKYQEEGGPGVAQIVALIRRVSSDPVTDVDRFLRANMFNWFIGGSDAHAKNYSLLIGAADEVRLAPLYDLSSQLPYPELITQRLAMKIGDHYDIARIGLADWRKLARACRVEEDWVLQLLTDMGRALPDAISAVQQQALADGLSKEVVATLAREWVAHVNARLAIVATVHHPKVRH